MKRNGTLDIEKDDQEIVEDKRLGINQTFVGHGVMIVVKETANDKVPLCLGLGPAANQVSRVFRRGLLSHKGCNSWLLVMRSLGSFDALLP